MLSDTSVTHPFSLVTSIPLYAIPQLVCSLAVDIWDISRLGLLQIKMPRTFLYKSAYGCVLSHFLGKYLNGMFGLCRYIFILSKAVGPFYIPTRCIREVQFLHILAYA